MARPQRRCKPPTQNQRSPMFCVRSAALCGGPTGAARRAPTRKSSRLAAC